MTLQRKKWYEKLASLLAKKGRRRMIYRELDKGHVVGCDMRSGCVPECTAFTPPQFENYLERFYVLSLSFLGIYLHRFWADDDDGLHDHPWHSISIVLSGSYNEEMPERQGVPYGPTITKLRRPLHPLFFCRSK